MLQQLITPIINWAKGPVKLILTTMLSSLGLNLVTADPYVSIVLAGQMFREPYIKARLKPSLLSMSIADSGSICSNIIPWNVHGAIFAATLGLGTAVWAPYTFAAYLTPVVTIILVYIHYLRKGHIADGVDAEQVYGAEPTTLPESTQLA